MSAQISYRVDGPVATLVIDQPARLNAMSLAMWRALPDLIARAAADPAIRAIALTGAGDKAFCAGADIARFGEERSGAQAVAAYDAAVEAAETALAEAAKPTVARINGLCYGGGLGLAMACDLRLTQVEARFRLPAARLGIGYGFAGVARLARRLGFSASAEILFTAAAFDAQEAMRLGIVSRVWSAEEFAAQASEYLAIIGANAPLSLIAAKRALIELEKPVANVAAAQAAIAACYESEDYAEGRLAFAQRREPQFRGR